MIVHGAFSRLLCVLLTADARLSCLQFEGEACQDALYEFVL